LDHKTSARAVARVDLGCLRLPRLLPPLLLVRVLLPCLPIPLAVLLLLAQLGEVLLLDGRVCWVIRGVAPGICSVEIIRPLYSTLKSLYTTLYIPHAKQNCVLQGSYKTKGVSEGLCLVVVVLPGCSGREGECECVAECGV
jgi:hypothetical protein